MPDQEDAPTNPENAPAIPEDEIFVVEVEDLPPEIQQRTTASTLRTAGIVSARVVVGIIAIAVASATVAASALLPLPHIRSSAPSTVVTPVPTAQQLVCPGGLLRLSNSEGTSATKPSALGDATVTADSTTSGPDYKLFASSDASTGGTSSAPLLLSAPASAGATTPGLIAGAQSESITSDDFSGLSSAACVAGAADVWLAGGSTMVGRTTLLTLADPSAVPATVALQIFGENGAVSAPGLQGIIVPAGGQRVLSLAGFAPDLASPVVHVTSSGGQVVANLEQSTVRGLEPGGIDFVGEQQAATQTIVIPGVVIANTKAVQASLGEPGFDDLSTIMRMYLPGTKGTTAHVSVLPENGKAQGNAFTLTVQAGKVTDLPLDDAGANGSPLSDGSYTFVVTTSAPIIAAVRVSTVGTAAVKATSDFAWLSSAQELQSTALVAVPQKVSKGMTSVLHLENPTNTPEHVTLHATRGSNLHVTVQAGSATQVPVVAGVSYRMTGFRSLYAAVTSTTDGGITGFMVSPPQESSSPLRVFG